MTVVFATDVKLQQLALSLIDEGIGVFIETGTGKGGTSGWVASQRSIPVYTTDLRPGRFEIAKAEIPANMRRFTFSSPVFLRKIADKVNGLLPLLFLDAHWNKYWPLLDELRVIRELYPQAVMVIHDFVVPGRPAFLSPIGAPSGGDGVNRLDYIRQVLVDDRRYRFFFPNYEPAGGRGSGFVIVFQDVEPFAVDGPDWIEWRDGGYVTE